MATPFFFLSDRTEKPVDHRKNLNPVQISDKQRQSGSACQSVACDLDVADFQFLFPVFFAILFHKVLYLFGWAILADTLVGFGKYYSTLPKDLGLFSFINRSI
jgi:hypothetical protein